MSGSGAAYLMRNAGACIHSHGLESCLISHNDGQSFGKGVLSELWCEIWSLIFLLVLLGKFVFATTTKEFHCGLTLQMIVSGLLIRSCNNNLARLGLFRGEEATVQGQVCV
ncbi:hypothetical protein ZIOFF_037018 [Zingiber officinale]|uniref:Uncharacterized protein n=1 Tax=Zingiber officinale TaxID=94328 RepID=A0A8J5GJD3_ZINOF|nr:hypothetical protein ZIOFF_037018 [Zingiber officinale]